MNGAQTLRILLVCDQIPEMDDLYSCFCAILTDFVWQICIKGVHNVSLRLECTVIPLVRQVFFAAPGSP